MTILDDLSLSVPIIQAPMAGVSTPPMAAAVSEAGALGSFGLGASTPDGARDAILEIRALTRRPFNVNVFCHAPAERDAKVEHNWIERSRPLLAKFGATPPPAIREIYRSFRTDDEMLAVLLETRPAVVSFHFGLPRADQIAALRETGTRLFGCATSVAEALALEAAGMDAIIAQGWSAGGHRGIFDPDAPDTQLSTEKLTLSIVAQTRLPVIAAGGLMDGADIRRALGWGATAVQLGTAFIACDESAADAAYRDRLMAGGETVMTAAISGRPARCLTNSFTRWAETISPDAIPAYPCAYDLGKAINAAAKAVGDTGYGAQWAGAGAGRGRRLPAGELIRQLGREMQS